MMGLLKTLKPSWWFSAHLHCRFEATVVHDAPSGFAPAREEKPKAVANPDEIRIDDDDDDETAPQIEIPNTQNSSKPSDGTILHNPDEIMLDDEVGDVAPAPLPPRDTKFVALDKCLPGRRYLEVRHFI